MVQTISDLWYGNIAPLDHCGAHDTKAKQLAGMMEQKREKLCVEFTAEQKAAFQKYQESSDSYLIRMMELAFCDGFCLATKLAAEALS